MTKEMKVKGTIAFLSFISANKTCSLQQLHFHREVFDRVTLLNVPVLQNNTEHLLQNLKTFT